MKTVRMTKLRNPAATGILPSCDFCGAKALYDAPTVKGPWAYMCKKCYLINGIKRIGSELTEDTPPAAKSRGHGNPAEKDDSKEPVNAEEARTLEEIMMTGERVIRCPSCKTTRQMEMDAEGECYCEGCGVTLLMNALI